MADAIITIQPNRADLVATRGGTAPSPVVAYLTGLRSEGSRRVTRAAASRRAC